MELTTKEKSISYLWRIIATLIVVVVGFFGKSMFNGLSTLALGKVAGMQFEASDMSYLQAKGAVSLIGHIEPLTGMIIAVLFCLIWWTPFKHYMKVLSALVICAIIIGTSFNPAMAYYDQKDWNEPYFILTNESAFWIPDVGDNASSQAKFGSIDYLSKNKIAAKRFSIPHAKLENSGTFSNYYVPTGRLIIVDRTPFNKEWIARKDKGTAAKNEGFDVQTKEGINITVGISISTYVTEDEASKFLFWYGVKPPVGDRKTPEVIFTSVYYGRSLGEVMDSNIRSKVQAILGNTFIKYTLDEANAKADEIMIKVEKELTSFLAVSGISLSYVGWADTFSFDPIVQDAINREYVAKKDELIAARMAQYTKTIHDLAVASAIRAFGNATDGKLPTNLTLFGTNSGISDVIVGKTLDNNKAMIPANTNNK